MSIQGDGLGRRLRRLYQESHGSALRLFELRVGLRRGRSAPTPGCPLDSSYPRCEDGSLGPRSSRLQGGRDPPLRDCGRSTAAAIVLRESGSAQQPREMGSRLGGGPAPRGQKDRTEGSAPPQHRAPSPPALPRAARNGCCKTCKNRLFPERLLHKRQPALPPPATPSAALTAPFPGGASGCRDPGRPFASPQE